MPETYRLQIVQNSIENMFSLHACLTRFPLAVAEKLEKAMRIFQY